MIYGEYYDKVYGGWLGKCLGGAAGAAVEGIKKLIPCEDFREMMRPDLPNDDLDLQLLWLEVLQKKGSAVTAVDLADAWNKQCWYPFNEYGIFLKNYERGIMPPYSGSFNNPLFCEGEGAPIRSEIWGMLCPGNPERAAYYAELDATLDHTGEAVWIEQYYAALEAQAFYEKDREALIKGELSYLPEHSRSRKCAELVISCYQNKNTDWKIARSKMLQRFGHFDFTNAVTNLGIVLIALLYGGDDLALVINIAFRSGFDTDCTCATAAAVWGIQKGAENIPEELKGLVQDQFIIGIQLERTDTSIRKLAQETCELGEYFGKTEGKAEGKKETSGPEVIYLDRPSIGFSDTCRIRVKMKNHRDVKRVIHLSVSNLPEGWAAFPLETEVIMEPYGDIVSDFTVSTSDKVQILDNINILRIKAGEEAGETISDFGIAGASQWTAIGPYFENLEKNDPPGMPSPHGEGCKLPTLECMVNNAVSLNRQYIDESHIAEAFSKEETCRIHAYEDLIPLDEVFTFKGQGCIYLKQEILSKTDRDVWVVIGNNDGFKLWINQKPVIETDEIRLWTPYNNYRIVHLKKGKNQIFLKLLKRTESMKFSMGFRRYEGEHFHRKRWCTDLACIR